MSKLQYDYGIIFHLVERLCVLLNGWKYHKRMCYSWLKLKRWRKLIFQLDNHLKHEDKWTLGWQMKRKVNVLQLSSSLVEKLWLFFPPFFFGKLSGVITLNWTSWNICLEEWVKITSRQSAKLTYLSQKTHRCCHNVCRISLKYCITQNALVSADI